MLKVVGVATFPSSIDFTNTTVAGLSTVSGNVDFKSDLNVDGSVTVGGVTNTNGTLNANGEINLGNATSDTITATGRFDSDLVPSTDDARDLGTSSLQWRNLHLDGTANIDVLDVDNGANIQGNVVINSLKVSDLTDNRVVIAGASGEIEDSGNLTFNGSTLGLTGSQTISSNLTVSGKIQPSSGSGTGDGIRWADNPGGGTGDFASITYYAETGENTKLRIATGNDSDDDIEIETGNDGFTRITSALDASSSTTGAFRVVGGVGIAKKLYVGTTLNVGGIITGNGSGLTTLNASNISSGTINDARLPGTITSDITGNAASSDTIDVTGASNSANYFVTFVDQAGSARSLKGDSGIIYNPSSNNLSVSGSISGSIDASNVNSGTLADGRIPNLNASKINAGTIGIDRLGSGTKNSTTFLAGDNTFRTVVVAINTLNNAGNNRIITSEGGSTANSESNLTFDGSTLGVSGAITCSGDITALTSDIRLKTGIQPIENAVTKILKLNGFTYNHNEVAGKLGLDTDIRYSGVSAQDVKEVLPEAVKPAPVNPDYMTVQYEKLVPLLIEAIKELKAEIDELKK